MASPLPPALEASYSAIIDEILANSDLQTISAKRIRKGLQERVEYDITPQKAAITDLIMLRFDKFDREQQQDTTQQPSPDDPEPEPEPAPTTNGATTHHHPPVRDTTTSSPTSPTKRKPPSASPDSIDNDADDDEDADLSSVLDSPPPAKKAKKSKPSTKETDEELAKRMQAELNAPSARSTRGGGSTRKKATAKKNNKVKTPKKKSKAKINSDDDSEVNSGSEKPEKERKGGFHKQFLLSAPLAALVGSPALSRPQTVKKIWAYVKERDLQDPSDKRQIRCDEAMRAVFRQEKVHMFTMNKLLALHLYPVEGE